MKPSSEFVRDYAVMDALGSDYCGTVFRVVERHTGEIRLVRFLDPESGFLSGNTLPDLDSINYELSHFQALQHPRIAFVRKIVQCTDERIFTVMDNCPGMIMGTVRSVRKPLERVRFIRQLCDALQYLHLNGMVHTDLRPETILFDTNGSDVVFSVIDGGLSHYLNRTCLPGTRNSRYRTAARYMSPEFLSRRNVDLRSDLYSLGIMLYEAVSGRRPFASSDTAAIISMKMNKPVPVLHADSSQTDSSLHAVINRLVSIDPADRPRSALDVSAVFPDRGPPLLNPPLLDCPLTEHSLPRREILAAFENACSGSGSVIALWGKRNIGKTRLLRELVSDFFLSGVTPVIIRSTPGTGTGHGCGVLSIITSMLQEDHPDLSIELIEKMYHLHTDDHHLMMADRHYLDHMIHLCALKFFSALSFPEKDLMGSPVIMILENCHFTDSIFWRFFTALAELIAGSEPYFCPCLYIIETNSPPPSESLRTLCFRSIEVLAYNQRQTAAMLESLSGVDNFPENLVSRVFALSQGIANDIRLISDILHGIGAVVHGDNGWEIDQDALQDIFQFDDLDALIDWFIANRLSQSETAVLTFLSLWQDGCPVPQLRSFLETLDPVPFDTSAIGSAVASGWISREFRGDIPCYVFRSERLRRKLHESIPAYQRLASHLELADHLRSRADVHPANAALQYFMADNRLHGCDLALTAGRVFRNTGAYHEAAEWFLRILDHMPDRNRTKIAGINFELAQVLLSIHEVDRALTALMDAEPILESRFYQKRDEAHYFMLLGLCHFILGDVEQARDNLVEALSHLPKTTAFDYRLKILAFLSRVADESGYSDMMLKRFNEHQKQLPVREYPYFSGILLEWVAKKYIDTQLFSSAEYFLKESVRCGERLNDMLAVIDRRLVIGQLFERTGKLRQAAVEYVHAVSFSRKILSRHALCRGLCHSVSLLLKQHIYQNSEKTIIEAHTIAESLDDPELKIWSSILYSHFLIETGHIDQAELLLTDAECLLDPQTNISLYNRVYINLAIIAERRGNYCGMLDLYTKLLDRVRSEQHALYTSFTYLYMAKTNCRLGNYTQAESLIARAENLLKDEGLNLPDCDILRAWILFRNGDMDASRSLVQQGLARAKKDKLLYQQAEAFQLLGLIEAHRNRFDSALVKFKKALDLFFAEHCEFEAAQVHRLLAEAYHSINRPDAAGRENEAAESLFTKLGAHFHVTNRQFSGFIDTDASSEVSAFRINPADISDVIQSLPQPDLLYERLLRLFTSNEHFTRGLIVQVSMISGKTVVRIGGADFDAGELDAILYRYSPEMRNRSMPSIASHPLHGKSIAGSGKPLLRSWLAILDHGPHERFILYLEDSRHSKTESHSILLSWLPVLSAALHVSRCIQGHVFKPELRPETGRRHEVIARSREMAKIMDAVKTVAYSASFALITGAEGTGKTFIVQYIHELSSFSGTPLVTIACDTMAQADQAGIVAGTILSAVQTPGFPDTRKRLIVLESIETLNEVQQGDLYKVLKNATDLLDHPLSDCRFLFTSTENLRHRVQQNTFSDVLYALISLQVIRLPCLTDRKEDIPHLARLFLERSSKLMKKTFTGFSPEALEGLINYSWPGNITELENAVESAVLFGSTPVINFRDLPKSIRAPVERSGILEKEKLALQSIEDIEEAHIRSVLHTTNGNKLRACELLGISRPTLDRKLEKFGITVQKKRKR
jgi:DNA-binding NtrC family response regulator/serine/threonine protein kinase/tetratricopeptide (TPR) repeat protein